MATMTIAEAEKILGIVTDALQMSGHRLRPISALKGYDLRQICTALKLRIANEFLHLVHRDDFHQEFAESVNRYDSLPWSVIMLFVPDDQVDNMLAERVLNPIDPSTRKFKDGPFASEETGSSFGEYCKALGPTDPVYWRKVYARIGLEYTPASPRGNDPVPWDDLGMEKVGRKETSRPGTIWVPQTIASLMLLWALNPENPYGYYTLLRWVSCGVFAFLALKALDQEKRGWVWVLGITAAFYNPIIPVHLTREIWSLVNVLTVGIAVASLFVFNAKRAKTSE